MKSSRSSLVKDRLKPLLTPQVSIKSPAHALKLKVVAEGVETEHQMHQLLSLNCDEMQGFLFSKPIPVEILKPNSWFHLGRTTNNNGKPKGGRLVG
jgi:sensor c-di-GMP phosphodiesterase-like protein